MIDLAALLAVVSLIATWRWSCLASLSIAPLLGGGGCCLRLSRHSALGFLRIWALIPHVPVLVATEALDVQLVTLAPPVLTLADIATLPTV